MATSPPCASPHLLPELACFPGTLAFLMLITIFARPTLDDSPATMPCLPMFQAQAACTPKELKELASELGGVAVHVGPGQLDVSAQEQQEMKASRIKRRVVEVISKVGAHGCAGGACVPGVHACRGCMCAGGARRKRVPAHEVERRDLAERGCGASFALWRMYVHLCRPSLSLQRPQ